jgi:hypothetical protein
LPKLDAKKALMRLYDPESPFVIVDPTEIERKQAKNTSYVGRLSDAKTLGFWMIVFAQPYRGRAIPFHFGVYSEATLNEEITSTAGLKFTYSIMEPRLMEARSLRQLRRNIRHAWSQTP